jgi:hypothetical protein
VTPDAYFKRYGAKRLIKLAGILGRADALHKKRGEPGYAQERASHTCGTPACAGGHWNASINLSPDSIRKGSFYHDETFGLSSEREWFELFGSTGCGDARTAREAASYIRGFVARKLKELAR